MDTAAASTIHSVFDDGKGILQMVPTWVPRPFNRPGNRLRLHSDDYFAYGMERGAITERWFSSIVHSEVKGAGSYEGMSFVNVDDVEADKILFRDFVEELGADLIGCELMETYGTWPMYSKFYDNHYPLFHHVHHREAACERVGQKPKHEHYFFPRQYNQTLGANPISYFGFDPSITKEEVIERLKNFSVRDTRITELSRAFRIELDTGWYTPAGVVHAPASLCTYEPQWNSDVMSVWENVVSGEVFGYESMAAFIPDEDKADIEKIFEFCNWELNALLDYRERYFRRPVSEIVSESYKQEWIAYGNKFIGAKRLTVDPSCSVSVSDDSAYGCVIIQGHGYLGAFECEAPTLVRFGDLTADEFFVGKDAARQGVRIVNESKYEPLVVLKHFGPDGNILQINPNYQS